MRIKFLIVMALVAMIARAEEIAPAPIVPDKLMAEYWEQVARELNSQLVASRAALEEVQRREPLAKARAAMEAKIKIVCGGEFEVDQQSGAPKCKKPQ